jgi:hypothetical protein
LIGDGPLTEPDRPIDGVEIGEGVGVGVGVGEGEGVGAGVGDCVGVATASPADPLIATFTLAFWALLAIVIAPAKEPFFCGAN